HVPNTRQTACTSRTSGGDASHIEIVVAVVDVIAEVVVPERPANGRGEAVAVRRLRRLDEPPELARVRSGEGTAVLRRVENPLAAHADLVGIGAGSQEAVPDGLRYRGRESRPVARSLHRLQHDFVRSGYSRQGKARRQNDRSQREAEKQSKETTHVV